MFVRIKGRVHYNICSMFLSTKNKSVMLQIITKEEKQKYHITLFCEKHKVSYYITFFETLLETAFSYGLCYSNRRITSFILLREKKSNFFSRTKGQVHYNTFNEQQKCHVTNIYTVGEKQKYHITFFCEKNKSIILHHVLPNSPENVFLRPLSF